MLKLSWLWAVMALLLFVCVGEACAEEDSPNEAARELMQSIPGEQLERAWRASLTGSWVPNSDSSDAGGHVALTEGRAKVGRTFRVNSQWSLTPELAYSVLQISAPAPARLPEDLHTVSAGLRTDYRVKPGLSCSFLFTPTIASDFKGLGHDDLRVRFGVTVRYSLSDKTTLLGGLVFQQGYHAGRVLPIVGVIYRPDDRWTISLAAPRPGVSYKLNKDLRFNVGGEMTGGEYQLHEGGSGAGVIRYRDFRALGGAEFTVAGPLQGEVAAGYAFARRFTFYDVYDPTRGAIDVDAGPFVKAGVRMAW